MIYLASPYTDESKNVMQGRYEIVRYTAAQLTLKGYVVYSPIVHFHPMACIHDLPRDFAFWNKINFAMLDHADSLYILKLVGWAESVGVREEAAYASKLGLRIIMLEPFPGAIELPDG